MLGAKNAGIWLILGLSNALFISAFSVQPTQGTKYADIRYLMASLPFLFAVSGITIFRFGKLNKYIPPVALTIFLGCNIFTFAPGNTQFRWMLPAFIGEVHNEYPTAYRQVADYLEKNGKPEEIVYAYPDLYNYPLVFYNGDTLRFGCLLTRKTLLPRETVDALKAPLLRDENFPH